MELGNKIKQLRIKMGLTQDELASRCDLSKGFISQIERDLTSPSIATLKDILDGLGTTLKDFFNDSGDDKIVFKKEETFSREAPKGYVITWLIKNAQKNEMEPVLLKLPPGGVSEDYPPHEGEVFGCVLGGSVKLFYGSKKHSVKCGDSFYFKAESVWRVENLSKSTATLIMVSSPPNF